MRTIANRRTIAGLCTAILMLAGTAQGGHGHGGHGHSSFSLGIDLSPRPYYYPYRPYYYAYPAYAPVYAPPYYAYPPPAYGYAASPVVQPQAAVAAAPAPSTYASAPVESSSQQWRSQSPTVASSGQRVEVTLPDPEGEVWVDGHKAKESADGKRVFSLAEGDRSRIVRVTAAWHRDGRIVSEERMVDVRPGTTAQVDFSRTQVADRSESSSTDAR